MVPVYRSVGNNPSVIKTVMMNVRILLYLIWHAYGEKCLFFSKKIAIRKEPPNKLIEFVYCIREWIAIQFASEALRAFNYANHFIDDGVSEY